MKEFVYILQKEIKVRLQKNEAKETDMLKKSLENSRVLGEAFDRLKLPFRGRGGGNLIFQGDQAEDLLPPDLLPQGL